MGAAIAGQEASPRADMRAWEFQVSPALAGLLTATAAIDVPAVAMPLDFGLRKIGHKVVFKLAGRFQIACTAMGTLLRMDVVVDEVSVGWGLRAKAAGVFTMFLAAMVRTGTLRVIAAGAWSFAALADLLKFVLQLRQPTPQFRVLRFQLGDPFS